MCECKTREVVVSHIWGLRPGQKRAKLRRRGGKIGQNRPVRAAGKLGQNAKKATDLVTFFVAVIVSNSLYFPRPGFVFLLLAVLSGLSGPTLGFAPVLPCATCQGLGTVVRGCPCPITAGCCICSFPVITSFV